MNSPSIKSSLNSSSVLHPSIDPPALPARRFFKEIDRRIDRLAEHFEREQEKRNQHLAKMVRCVNDGKFYPSIVAASAA